MPCIAKVAVNDATSMTNVFNQAKEASIPVVTFDSDSENAERAYCIMPDTDEAIGERTTCTSPTSTTGPAAGGMR